MRSLLAALLVSTSLSAGDARLQSMLCELVAFPTEPGNKTAMAAGNAWLERTARGLGLTWRDTGLVKEIELPGPPGAPTLGLLVHGDVQFAGASEWTVPAFSCTARDGYLYGRGVADNKSGLVIALLAMAAFRDSGARRAQTVRLLVGSDEEGDNTDVATYLKTHRPPELTLVLDSAFPLIIGEKAWDGLELTAPDPYRVRGESAAPWAVVSAQAGIAPSIVPPRAAVRLRWRAADRSGFDAAVKTLCPAALPAGYRCEAKPQGAEVVLTTLGRAAHSGMNIEAGRNALVFAANALQGKLAPSGAADLLAFSARAGADLGLAQRDPLWGSYLVNVGTLKPAAGKLALTINVRRPPPRTGPQNLDHLRGVVARFNRERGSALETGGFFEDWPLVINPKAKIVARLLAAYERATGEKAQPAVVGGGSYAKRFPNSIPFGTWFPGEPYPGHDVDERIPVRDLDRGVAVILEALKDLATGPAIPDPLKP
jgi:dipeptidase D